jgi:quinol monooxygenase YgiN
MSCVCNGVFAGCIYYDAMPVDWRNGEWMLVAKWRSAAAMAAHDSSAHVKSLVPRLLKVAKIEAFARGADLIDTYGPEQNLPHHRRNSRIRSEPSHMLHPHHVTTVVAVDVNDVFTFKSLALKQISATRAADHPKGVLSCTLFQQLGSNVFLWIEQYQDKDAVAAHHRHVGPANVLGMMRTGLLWVASA